MKIERAVAEPGENALRNDLRGHERDKAGPFKHIGTYGDQIGRGIGRYHSEARIMRTQHWRQRNMLGFASEEDDCVKHLTQGLLSRPCRAAEYARLELRSGS
jgi:hypothetical protein